MNVYSVEAFPLENFDPHQDCTIKVALLSLFVLVYSDFFTLAPLTPHFCIMASRETPSRIADLIKLFDSKAASEIKQELLIANQLILSQTNNTSNPPEVSTIV